MNSPRLIVDVPATAMAMALGSSAITAGGRPAADVIGWPRLDVLDPQLAAAAESAIRTSTAFAS